MIKKIIITIIVVIIIILLIVLNSKPVERTLICSGTNLLVGGQSSQIYTFEGIDYYIEKQKLEVNIITDNKDTLDDYFRIVSGNPECSNIIQGDDYVSYVCNYDLKNNHYYEELEDNNQRLTFDSIKKKFEEDNFVCSFR